MPQELSKLEKEVRLNIATLEAMFFLVQSLHANASRLRGILEAFPSLSRSQRLRLRDELREEVKWLRGKTGAITTDRHYRELFDAIRGYPGYYYLDKIYIERALFTNYVLVFPRWPYMKDHAAVTFDGKVEHGLRQIFELEGQCLNDARELLKRARLAEKGVEDFRKRTVEDQLEMLMFSRAGLIASMNFVEAYLHGLAYDCFHRHHSDLPIEDHDLLGEWDSQKKRRRFVDFREKVFRYPVIVGRTRRVEVNLSGCKPAEALIDYAKEFRAALVHPSPFIDPITGNQSKFAIQVGVGSEIAEMVMRDAVAYAVSVEKAIGNDPKQTAPWLYEKAELSGAALERPEEPARAPMDE